MIDLPTDRAKNRVPALVSRFLETNTSITWPCSSTARRTSHAAVVARQLGVACVVGCGDISFDFDHGKLQTRQLEVNEGEWITVDGATGQFYRGAPEFCTERPLELIERVQAWKAQSLD